MMSRLTAPAVRSFLCPDVLDIIFGLLEDRPTVLALMQTSKDQYFFGIKHLLRLGVTVASDTDLGSFCRFMLSEFAPAGPFLRKLEIHVELDDIYSSDESESEDSFCSNREPDPLASAPLLVRVLLEGHLAHLEDLSIEYFNPMLQRSEDLTQAFQTAAFPALRRLRLTVFGTHFLDILRSLQASLEEIDVNFWWGDGEQPPDVLEIISRSRSTLQKITVWWTEWSEESIVMSGDSDVPQFPLVHTLSVRFVWHHLRLPILLHAFPNLRRLDITDVGEPREGSTESFERNRAVRAEDTWGSLQHLAGDLDSLYALGLKCPVQRLDINKVPLHGADEVHAIIQGTLPSHLLLHIGHHEENSVEEIEQWLPELLDIPHDGITHLALDVAIDIVKPMAPTLFFGALSVLLSRLPSLTFFVLRAQPYEPAEFPEDDEDDPVLNPPHFFVRLMHWQTTYPKVVALSCPSLQYIAFNIAGVSPGYWDVSRFSTQLVLSELRPSVGEQLLLDHNLAFHRRTARGIYWNDFPPLAQSD